MLLHKTKLAVCLLGLALLATTPARAQRGGGGGGMGGPGGMGPGGFPGGMGGPRGGDRSGLPGGRNMGPNAQPRMGGGNIGRMGRLGTLQMGPAGRWWDDRHFVHNLKITPDQQRRMDAIFDSNRPVLQQSLAQLQSEQGRLTELAHAPNTDEAALLAQIDRVSAARTALEKADAHVRLALRKEMDADQLAKLDKSGE